MTAPRHLVWRGIACQPGCMARGRHKQRKTAADRTATNAAASVGTSTEGVAEGHSRREPEGLSRSSSAHDGSTFCRSGPMSSGLAQGRTTTAQAAPIRPPSSPGWEREKVKRAELRRLSDLSNSLVKLHREEAKLLRERDALIAKLRAQDVPWSSLAMRTGLSRQALSKRAAIRDHA